MASQTLSVTESNSGRLSAACVFFLGTVFVFIAGFAQPEALHEAAHDTRHVMALPCH